jgi:hypothetical protein
MAMIKDSLIFGVVVILLAAMRLSQAQSAPATAIDVYDGFETPELTDVWIHDRVEPGAMEIETNLFRTGHGALKVTVRPHDKFEPGGVGTSPSERAELMEAPKLTSKENVPYEYSFSMFFPTNFPIESTRLVIAQWKQYCANGGNCSEDSPVLALRYVSGELKITQNIDSPHEKILWQQKDEFRGRWLDFKFHVRFSTNETGHIIAWLNEKQILDYKGITADTESPATGYPSPSRFFFKMGLYRNSVATPWTSYIDEYRKKQLPPDDL